MRQVANNVFLYLVLPLFFAACILLFCSQAMAGPLPYGKTAQPSGVFAGIGIGNNLRGDAAYNYRGHIYGGYKWENGIKFELRHTSVIGSDDGIDITGDNENDLSTSDNSIVINWEYWFLK